jgi:hypothetical protein
MNVVLLTTLRTTNLTKGDVHGTKTDQYALAFNLVVVIIAVKETGTPKTTKQNIISTL